MSTAGAKPTNLTTTKQFIGKNGVTFTRGVGVVVDTVNSDGSVIVDIAAAGELCVGVYTGPDVAGDGTTRIDHVALLCGGGTQRVKCSGTATAGTYAIAGTAGFQNQTLGGGTVVKHIAGVFLESGVTGDFVEMMFGAFGGVGA